MTELELQILNLERIFWKTAITEWTTDGDLPGMEPASCDYDLADVVIEALDDDFVDFGLWLAQEITGRSMTRIDLESCLADWKAGSDE